MDQSPLGITVDALVEIAAKMLSEGGATALSGLGWILFLIERYYVTPRREVQFREDLNAMSASNTNIADKTTDALGKMGLVLEVIRDRTGRGP